MNKWSSDFYELEVVNEEEVVEAEASDAER
jgi:hypothetical protein